MERPSSTGVATKELLLSSEHTLQMLLEKDRLSQLGRIVKGLIHNLNGPLQNLSMLGELLVKGQDQMDRLVLDGMPDVSEQWAAGSAKQRQKLQRLTRQISDLADILRDFTLLIETERNEAHTNLEMLIEKVVKIFRADLFFKHHVEVDLHLEGRLPNVKIKGRELAPALIHILQNAATAVRTSPVKKISIECHRKPDRSIHLIIRDSGCGPGVEGHEPGTAGLFSRWPLEILNQEKDEIHFGFGLFAVRHLLVPYGVDISMERQGAETVVDLRIPASALIETSAGEIG